MLGHLYDGIHRNDCNLSPFFELAVGYTTASYITELKTISRVPC